MSTRFSSGPSTPSEAGLRNLESHGPLAGALSLRDAAVLNALWISANWAVMQTPTLYDDLAPGGGVPSLRIMQVCTHAA
jgi:hypothetical protein